MPLTDVENPASEFTSASLSNVSFQTTSLNKFPSKTTLNTINENKSLPVQSKSADNLKNATVGRQPTSKGNKNNTNSNTETTPQEEKPKEDEDENRKKGILLLLKDFCCSKPGFILLGVGGGVCLIALVLGLGLGLGLKSPKTYGVSCESDSECITSGQLICNKTCTCTYDKFWNGALCVDKYSLNVSCDNSNQCQDYKSLSCQSGTCQCPTGSDWFWATATSTCVQCPTGWTIYYGHCYYVNTNKLNWYSASSWCQNYSATLMIIRNDAEYNLLYSFYTKYSPSGRLWIGGRSVKVYEFYWPDGTSLAKSSTYWCASEPNNSGGNSTYVKEDCVFMWTVSSKICLNDYTGSSAEVFACEKSL